MAESPKSTQKKITSFTSGSNSSQESSGHDETKTPKKSSEKKSKRKHDTTSESESPNKDENARENSTHNGVDASTSSSSSPSVHAWTFEEEQILLQKVEEYLQEKESSDDAKKKPFYLKSIEWDKLSVCGDHTTQQAHARFMTISNRVRKMRTAMEILQDMKEHHKKAPPTAKKRKLDVDPDLPKKPLSSYFQFSMAKRKKVVEKHPELNSVEIGKKLSKRWNNLSDEKKQKYSDNYHKGMEEYHHQMIEYLQKNNGADTAPPLSGFELWAAKERKEIKSERPDISDKKLNKKLKRRWENLEDDEKTKWFQKEKVEIKRYNERVSRAKKKKESQS